MLMTDIVSAAYCLRFEDIPEATVERAKLFLLDTIGVILAGRNADGTDGVLDLVREMGGMPQAKIIGVDMAAPAPWAALANSFMAHARDFDDLYEPGGTHVNVTVVPAALAASQKKVGVSGERFLVALIAGVDLVCRFGVSLPIYRGWHVSATYGVFGAALSAGLILGLDEEELTNAMGLAYSQSAGTRQGRLEGTLSKRLQPALACHSGVLAALLAEKGLTGPKACIEGIWGLSRVYGQDHLDISEQSVEKLTHGLGNVFLGDDLSFKLYPCCKVTHTSIEAALALAEENRLQIDEIDKITVRVSEGAYNTVGKPFEIKINPQVDAQFSIPYTVALALTEGQVTLSGFEEDRVLDPRLKELADKVHVEIDPDMKDDSANMVNLATRMSVYTRRGVFSKNLDICRGHPSNPPMAEDICEKFSTCARFGGTLSESRIASALQMLTQVEQLADINRLFEII